MSNKLKVMVADIETSPNVGYFWRPGYNITLSPDNIVDERKIICVAYKYLGDKKVHSLEWDKHQNDKEVVREFSRLMSEADAVIFHNGDSFDIKWVKGRVLYHKLPPLTNVTSIDTLKLSRQNFNLNSHKLDYLAHYLGSEGKMATNFSLWKKVMAGDKKALKYMVDYCKKDVVELETVFQEMLPYVDKMPVHVGILTGGSRDDCPSCGSSKQQKRGTKVTRAGKYQRFQCQSCGHWWSDTRQLKEKK